VPGIQLSSPHDSFLADLDGDVVLVHERQGARRQDAGEYVKRFGVSLDEAFFRLDLQEAIGKLVAELTVSEADSYAGMWIQHEPDFRVIVRFTERGEETLLPYLTDSPLAGLVEVRGASITLADLAEEQHALGETLQSLGIAQSRTWTKSRTGSSYWCSTLPVTASLPVAVVTTHSRNASDGAMSSTAIHK
jgi:hypothetical protein